ncbi:MAG: haloacid dehalogenase-like hydrolase [Oscillospiraceae bacterium]|nr:haloacid dehalogenase-like hydrolase [Oscillospiraceae bacterium]
MNVYDFDKTIFYPDSSYCFFCFCLRHYPRAVLKSLPVAGVTGLQWFIKQADTRHLKEKLFSFLPYLDNVDAIVQEFWAEYQSNIADWYLAQKRDDDLIISASPEFLLRPITERLGVQLIATRMDSRTGRITGNNCHDSEKISRFLRDYPNGSVDVFYSDSLSDSPMAWFASKAFLVKEGRELVPWPNK